MYKLFIRTGKTWQLNSEYTKLMAALVANEHLKRGGKLTKLQVVKK